MLKITVATLLSLLSSLAVSDYTHTWWEEGYPYSTYKHWDQERKPVNIIQTSAYTFAWNTRTLEIPHFGPMPLKVPYAQAARHFGKTWKDLPAAQLKLSYTVGSETYTCVGAEAPNRAEDWHRGPRMIESGRYFQRLDVWKLKFKNTQGEVSQKLARIEFGTWSSNLTITFRMEEEVGDGKMQLSFTTGGQEHLATTELKGGQGMARIALVLQGDKFVAAPEEGVTDGITLTCENAKVDYTNEFQAHRIQLFKVKGLPVPEGATANDQIWEIPFTIKNTTDEPKDARLLLDQTENRPFGQTTGEPVTGVSMILCDEQGRPTGLYVQHSKNWHVIADQNIPYQFQWFRGLTKIPLQPGEERKLKLRVFHAQWGGVSAASHAQLCLIGWGMNSLWEETALGAYGESFCYEPTRAHRDCMITDMRPLMLTSYDNNKKYSWTHNMGGGDFFIFERPDGTRLDSHFARSSYLSHGPCLTETVYTGMIGENEAKYEVRVFLSRTDDIARTTYQLDLEALTDFDLSRAVIFSIGADYYNSPAEGKVAWGNTEGNAVEWLANDPKQSKQVHLLSGATPWVSMHAVKRPNDYKGDGGIASRGMIIRDWQATLGGQAYPPYLQQRSTKRAKMHHSQAELVLPPNIKMLKKGDRISAEVEFLLPPENKRVYYGDNKEFRQGSAKSLNHWQSIEREARLHEQKVEVTVGKLLSSCPDIRVQADAGKVSFTVNGEQTRYNAITITGLRTATEGTLKVNGKPLDQAIYGEDYYQTIYDPATKTYTKTYNAKFAGKERHEVSFQ